MLDTKRRVGAGRATPCPGDCVSIATPDGDVLGTVEVLVATRIKTQWTVDADDGRTLIVTDPSAVTLVSERMLPLVLRGDRWVLDVRTVELRRSRGVGQ